MYKLIFAATSFLITLVATYATLVAVPETYIYRIHLLIIFLLLLCGYIAAFFIWVSDKINFLPAWRTLVTCKRKGILRIYEDGELGTIIGKPHVASSRTVRIMQTTGIGLTKQLKQEMVTVLEHPNARIKVLIAKSEGDFIKEVEQVEGRSRMGNIVPEVRSVEGILAECVEEAKNKYAGKDIGKIFIGHYNTQFRTSLLICDNLWCWMTLILPPKRAPLSLSYELVRSNTPLIDDCICHFDRVWEIVDKQEIK